MTLPYFLKDVAPSFPYGPAFPGRTPDLSGCGRRYASGRDAPRGTAWAGGGALPTLV